MKKQQNKDWKWQRKERLSVSIGGSATKNKEIELKEIVLKGIERFNEIRLPEAKTELVKIKKNEILVRFSGHMCFTCGAYDYFDDLIFEMLEVGIWLERKEFQRENENSYLVKYKILKVEK